MTDIGAIRILALGPGFSTAPTTRRQRPPETPMTRVELKITGGTYEKTMTVTTPSDSPLLPILEILTQTLQQYRDEIQERAHELADLWRLIGPYMDEPIPASTLKPEAAELILQRIRHDGQQWIEEHLLPDRRPLGTFNIDSWYVVAGEGHPLDQLLNLLVPNWRLILASK